MEKTFVKFKEGDGTVHEALYDEYIDAYFVKGKEYTFEEVIECLDDGTPFDDIPDDAVFTLTPLSCFGVALGDANIVEDKFAELETKRFRKAFDIFEQKMKDNGYAPVYDNIHRDVENPERPDDIFKKVVKVFYPESDEDQREIAYDLFIYHMKRHGNIKTEENEDKE